MLKAIMFRKHMKVYALVALLIFFTGSEWSTWWIWHSGRIPEVKDKIAATVQVLTFAGFALASVCALFTLIAALAPRWLNYLGFGPDLTLKWKANNPAYVHRWDRQFISEDPAAERRWSRAIILRMAVCNRGMMAAESVQVVIEEIRIKGGKGKAKSSIIDTTSKFSRLLWADSYDLDKFETLKHHRCPTGIEPIIHAKHRHFVDFAFLFEPGSEFYTRPETVDAKSKWYVHPFYQWLPAHGENAVLRPDNEYELIVAISAKNYGTVKYSVRVDCKNSSMPDKFPDEPEGAFKIVSGLETECPVRIGGKRRERVYSL